MTYIRQVIAEGQYNMTVVLNWREVLSARGHLPLSRNIIGCHY